MTTNKRIAKILYRTKKYGTWNPASIFIPDEIKDIREYCVEDLKKMKISVSQVTVQKIEKNIKT